MDRKGYEEKKQCPELFSGDRIEQGFARFRY